jgi:MoaA/NifB/PqqE/SkfB family radical SAM enzyme
MDFLHWLKIKRQRYDIFLKPLPFYGRFRVVYKKIKSRFFANGIPNTLVLALTYRCQLDCVHCGVKGCFDQNKTELATDEVKNIILQARRMGVYMVVFFGGEPLLRKDIAELVGFCTSRGIISAISTNGFLLTRDIVSDLKQKGLSFLNVSLDNAVPLIHDRLRQSAGSYQKALEGIRNCVSQDINVFISTYATPENIQKDNIRNIILLSQELGVTGVRLLLGVPCGKWLKNEDIILSKEQKEYLYGILDPTFVYLEGVCNNLTECNALLKRLFYVSAYGEVQPCGFVPLYFGNIREEPLDAIWKRMVSHGLYDAPDRLDCIMHNMELRNKYLS